jgi:hypothetical protein
MCFRLPTRSGETVLSKRVLVQSGAKPVVISVHLRSSFHDGLSSPNRAFGELCTAWRAASEKIALWAFLAERIELVETVCRSFGKALAETSMYQLQSPNVALARATGAFSRLSP